MKYFFCKLTPPRPTFMIDMTDGERQLMRQHVGYWSELAAKGSAIVFGPVADPQGGYGIAVIEAPDEAAVRELSTHDPVVKAGAGFSYAIHAMPQIVLGERAHRAERACSLEAARRDRIADRQAFIGAGY